MLPTCRGEQHLSSSWCAGRPAHGLKQTNCSQGHNSWFKDQNSPCGSVLWVWILFPPNPSPSLYPPMSQNMAVFGDRVIAGVFNQDEVGPNPIWLLSLKKGKFEYTGHKGRWLTGKRETSTSQGAGPEQPLLPRPSGRTNPEPKLLGGLVLSHFWPPELGENKFMLFKPPTFAGFVITVLPERLLPWVPQSCCFCYPKGRSFQVNLRRANTFMSRPSLPHACFTQEWSQSIQSEVLSLIWAWMNCR